MDRQPQLQALLKQILGSTKVYYQPPANLAMEYPCIVYQQDNARTAFAGNKPYNYRKRYQVTYIDRDPTSVIPDTIACLESATFNRYYAANQLHHSVFTLYF